MTINEALEELDTLFIPRDGVQDRLADAFEMAVEALRKQEICEDCVSRQAVLDTIGNVPDHDDGMVFEALSHAQRDVALLPPVTPQPKIGRWIYDRTRDWDGECKYECSECGMGADVDYPFCMRCGARMEAESEVSE